MFKETRAFLLYIFYIYVYIYIYFLYIENIQYNIQYTIDISILSTPFLSAYCFRETQSDVTGEAGHATCSFLTFYLTSDQPLYPMHEQLRHPLWTRWTLLQMHWTLLWTPRMLLWTNQRISDYLLTSGPNQIPDCIQGPLVHKMQATKWKSANVIIFSPALILGVLFNTVCSAYEKLSQTFKMK